MKSLKDIERLVCEFKTKPSQSMNARVEDDVRKTIEKKNKNQIAVKQLTIWSIIMTKPITKYAAAIIVIAGIASLTLMNTVPKAWAIEQTIEALQNIQGIYLSGVARYPDQSEVNIEMWARPHSQNPSASGDFRLHEGEHHVCIASESQNLTYVYTEHPEQAVVYVTEGLNRVCNLFPSSNLFEHIKEIATHWEEEYREDPETGRDCVFVKFQGPALNTARYWLLQCDLETKYPLRISVWFNEDYSGQPHYDLKTISYNPEMPEDLFEFNFPKDTQVIDCRPIHRILDENPDCGITVDDLDINEAYIKVVKEYWNAVIEQDHSMLQRIRSLMDNGDWDELLKVYQTTKPIGVKISKMNHLQDPGTFAEVTCIIKTEDGKTAHSKLNVEIRQTNRGKIGLVAGTVGPELKIVND